MPHLLCPKSQDCHFGRHLGKLCPKYVVRMHVHNSRPPVDGHSTWQSALADGQVVHRPFDRHPDHRAKWLFASRPLDGVADQRSEWPSAMPSARADRRMEWPTACCSADIHGEPWTSDTSASASNGCSTFGQPC
jgi:hypothetical protein